MADDYFVTGQRLTHSHKCVMYKVGLNGLASHLVRETPNDRCHIRQKTIQVSHHSTVTLFARLRGWSTSVPLAMAA
jgi:hypothetical protein